MENRENEHDVEVRVCSDGCGTEILVGGERVLGGFKSDISADFVAAWVKAHEFLVHERTGEFPIVFWAVGYFGCEGDWFYGDHGL